MADRVAGIAHFFESRHGWARRGLLLLAGMLGTLALPPLGLWPVLLLSLPVLILSLNGATSRWGWFGAGWWWGVGFFSLSFYWIANALLIEPEKFAWMIPFATLGLGAGMALFTGLTTWVTARLTWAGPVRIVVLAAAWVGGEWLRSWVLTGFPWNLLGSVWDGVPAVMQLASLLGVYGLSALTVLVCGLPVLALEPGPWRQRMMPLSVAAGLVLAVYGWGSARLETHPTAMVEGVTLRLVQANINQRTKWREEVRFANLVRHLDLSGEPATQPVTHIIWPETAVPYSLAHEAKIRALLAEIIPAGGYLLTGTPRYLPATPGHPAQLWNSLVAEDSNGVLVGSYDKVHLVPFGEYVPLRSVLPLQQIAHSALDYSVGPGPRTLSLAGLPPFSPLICYEAIFPAAVVGADQVRPEWLLNITNDGWFGLSAGPHQHLAAARMRAVEEGLPMVRAANTGISAVFDPLGREVARLGLGETGVLDVALPRPVDAPFYARTGNRVILVLAGAVLVLAMLWRGLMLRRRKDDNG